MRDGAMRELERAKDESPDDLAALRRWADARKRAGLELLPDRVHVCGNWNTIVSLPAIYVRGGPVGLAQPVGVGREVPVICDIDYPVGTLGILLLTHHGNTFYATLGNAFYAEEIR